jgi:adenosylhomocysteine nucleosidase
MTIFVPRGAEAAAVRRARTPHRVVAVAAGRAAAGALQPFQPGEVAVVLGLCGALRERRVGDVVVYHAIAADETTLEAVTPAVDAAFSETLAERLRALAVPTFSVTACTTDHVVTTRAERRTLAERYDADVVDMEGAHLAAALAARGVRFAMVRVVSDDASRDLPALEGAIRADGRVDGARIALAFARSPWGAFAFVHDVRTALAGLTAVARVLAG